MVAEIELELFLPPRKEERKHGKILVANSVFLVFPKKSPDLFIKSLGQSS